MTEARACIPAADAGAPVTWAQRLTTSLTQISDVAADSYVVSVWLRQKYTSTRPNSDVLQQCMRHVAVFYNAQVSHISDTIV